MQQGDLLWSQNLDNLGGVSVEHGGSALIQGAAQFREVNQVMDYMESSHHVYSKDDVVVKSQGGLFSLKVAGVEKDVDGRSAPLVYIGQANLQAISAAPKKLQAFARRLSRSVSQETLKAAEEGIKKL